LRCIQLAKDTNQAKRNSAEAMVHFETITVNFDLKNILATEFPRIDWKFIHPSLERQAT